MEHSSFDMDAISHGVQKRYEASLGLHLVVMRETIEIARKLGMSNHEIQEWLSARRSKDNRP